MKAAIIGLPLSGKTTLFTSVTGHPPATSDPLQEHQGVVDVPEARLDLLVDLYRPKKVVHATIDFVDYPGFTVQDARGQNELRRHLASVRTADVLVLVVRDFKNASVPAYRERIDPAADLQELSDELIFADLEIVAGRIEKLEKALSKPTKTHDEEKRELALLSQCREALEESKPLATAIHSPEEARMISSFAFLTEKPAVVVFNVDEDRAGQAQVDVPEHAHAAIVLCADIEAQINDLDPDERADFLHELGIETPVRDRLIRTCYEAAGLISFFTAGPTEVHAWSVPRGTVAQDAAGKIHTDLARGFIRAETVAYDDLAAAGDFKSARAAGTVRQEGKSYVVQDGDFITIKFNV